jgi:hypothetical protein
MPGCSVQIGEAYIMCRPHWGFVPSDFREELHAAYQLATSANKQRLIAEYAVALALEALPSGRGDAFPANKGQ